MKITDLFEVVLPGKEVSLENRVNELQKKGIAFAIYASNFIPFMLEITVDGKRQLAVAEFEAGISAEEAHLEIEKNSQYAEALVEDFLAAVGDQRLVNDGQPAIVCTGARFDSMGPEGGKSTPYMVPVFPPRGEGEEPPKSKERNVGLATEDACFRAGIKFLLVRK